MLRVPFLAECIDAGAGDGLLAAGARRSHFLVVVSLAVGHAFVFEEGTGESASAELAVEVLRVPLSAEGIDAIAEDGKVARAATRCENLVEAFVAVGSSVALEEVASEGRCALSAHEAVHVPLLVKGGDAAVCDSLVAVRAFGTELDLVAALAVSLTGQLEEGTRAERVVT